MNSRRMSNFLAYIVLGIVAVSLLVKYVLVNWFDLTGDFLTWFDKGAYYLTALATLICAFTYAKSRRNGGYFILLIIFIAVIILFTFVL